MEINGPVEVVVGILLVCSLVTPSIVIECSASRVGLGGIGGPYRLDGGHQVFQVPDDVKEAVPEHIRKAARELGQKVFKERLKEIEMSEYEHEVYEKYTAKIAGEIKMLRAIIESLEAKSHDRQWVVSHRHPPVSRATD